MAKTYTREERREARKFADRDTAGTRREIDRLEALAASVQFLASLPRAATAPRGWDFV